MLSAFLRRFFGSHSDRYVKKQQRVIQAARAKEDHYAAMDDATLRGQTALFRERLASGESLEALMPNVFAAVREAATRALGLRPFDVQLIGGTVLFNGMIAEMRTGEGKTLVATLPAYLVALEGKGVHVITVNDYLARRDAGWMGKVFEFLGMTVGCVTGGMDDMSRQRAYGSDITYVTNNELGFDYLRDNMKVKAEDLVLRDLHYALIDEVDSILVDEARTPLIISGPATTSSELYRKIYAVVKTVPPEGYEKDEKHRTVTLTEEGQEFLEQALIAAGLVRQGENLYDVEYNEVLHLSLQSLRAAQLFHKDQEYIVKDGKVMIVDEFTGRIMDGRRFSDGLHQALEAKEGVAIERENIMLASITYQNLFRSYNKLAGMTGTAMTEAAEFEEIYNLSVISIPTHNPVQRIDDQDRIFCDAEDKQAAIIAQIQDCFSRKQPILVGTTSIEKSEMFSKALKKHNIAHQVLNARYHEQESEIIKHAGKPGAVTIATNMAGRGTDIQLGGNLEVLLHEAGHDITQQNAARAQHAADKATVLAAGGLFVLGTERHESRRIDNQLRGRSGRQGDPGISRFYISLEDDLMRIFGGDRMHQMVSSMGLMKEGEEVNHSMLSRTIEKAQKRVEGRNFDMRKNLLKFDDVMNEQRKLIYAQRREIMHLDNVRDLVDEFRQDVVDGLMDRFIPVQAYKDHWDLPGLTAAVKNVFALELPLETWCEPEGFGREDLAAGLAQAGDEKIQNLRQTWGDEKATLAEKFLILKQIDTCWQDHLQALDHLRSGIGLRAMGQRDPLNEYKQEAFHYFEAMLARIREEVTALSLRMQVVRAEDLMPPPSLLDHAFYNQGDTPPPPKEPAHKRHVSGQIDPKNPATWGRVLRNAPCPCGSGKKYKQCHGVV
jgi:preprotein translocase subunit SecA